MNIGNAHITKNEIIVAILVLLFSIMGIIGILIYRHIKDEDIPTERIKKV
jgi:hypothetical protein